MKPFLTLLLICLFLISCSSQNEINLPESEVIAIVGEEKITIDLYNAYLIANGMQGANDNVKKLAFDNLINEVAMSNIALKKKLPLSTEQLYALKYLQIRSQAKNAQFDYLAKNKISEEEILKEYEKAQSQTAGLEFYVHHMLFKDEVEAIKVLDKINSTDDYLIQEKQFIEANKNMKNVGDLGWVSLAQLPQSFKDQLLVTEKNTVVNKVVISPYGAHIIYLKDTRELQPPALEDVRQGIINTLSNQKLSNFKQLAKAKAHIMLKK